MIIDTHAHYDDEAFEEDRAELLSSLEANGIGKVINVSASIDEVRKTLKLIKQYDFVYGAIGVHPDEVGELNDESFAFLKESANDDKIVAIGEIGLDYYWDKESRELQKEWFVKQLELAREMKLPVIIHSRQAAEDTMEIMRTECKKGGIKGVMHCYSYSPEQASEYLDMGLYLGIGGVVTFKNAKKLVETVKEAPISKLLLETDCPYLAPEPNRGKRNSSLNLPYVIAKIAEIKGVSEEEVIAYTEENANALFSLVKTEKY